MLLIANTRFKLSQIRNLFINGPFRPSALLCELKLPFGGTSHHVSNPQFHWLLALPQETPGGQKLCPPSLLPNAQHSLAGASLQNKNTYWGPPLCQAWEWAGTVETACMRGETLLWNALLSSPGSKSEPALPSQLKFHLPWGAQLDGIKPPSTLRWHCVYGIYLTRFTYHPVLYLFSFINSPVTYSLLLNKASVQDTMGDKKMDEIWSLLSYISPRQQQHMSRQGLYLFLVIFSFFITHKKAWQSRHYCTFFGGWMDGWMMNGQLHGWMDGWMHVQMNGWIDG